MACLNSRIERSFNVLTIWLQMMNCMTNCQYASYILLIQEHKKSHLVEKRLKKKKKQNQTKTIQNEKNYPLGRMFPYHYHPSTKKM